MTIVHIDSETSIYVLASGPRKHLPHVTRLNDPRVVVQVLTDYIDFIAIAVAFVSNQFLILVNDVLFFMVFNVF